MSFFPSASKLDLAARCAFAWSPHAGRWPKRGENAFAQVGTAVHLVADRAVTGEVIDLRAIGDQVALGGADWRKFEAMARNAIAWVETNRREGDTWLTEAPFAYHVERGEGRTMKRAGPRDYSDQRRGELSGTADLVVRARGQLRVWDWKTGHGVRGEDPRESPQLRFLGLAAARTFGASAVSVGFLHVDEAGVEPADADLDELDLGATAATLREIIASIPSATPRPGPHCYDLYCPVVATCPATMAAMAAIARDAAPTMPLLVEIQSAEHAAHTRVRLKMVRDAVDQIDASLKAWSKANGPIEIAPGVLWGVREQERETIDLSRPGAYAALVRHLGQEKVDEACTIDTSKAALMRVSGKRGRGLDPVLDELRQLGAIRVSKFEKLEEFKAKKGASS